MTDEIDNDQPIPETTPEPRMPNGKFAPGFTGNPKGRPKKNRLTASREVIDAQVAHMMMRDHSFAENGEKKSLPFIVWLLKKLQADALQGNRYAQRTLLEWFTGTLKRREADKMAFLEALGEHGGIDFEKAQEFLNKY